MAKITVLWGWGQQRENEVEATLVGRFGVHPSLGGEKRSEYRWCVTHRATKRVVVQVATKAIALRAAKRMEKQGAAWDFETETGLTLPRLRELRDLSTAAVNSARRG